MDYGAEPPEINSGRMYSGVGSGPMLAAAAAWQALADELAAAAAGHGGTTADLLTGPWMGPSAVMMGASGAQSVAWLMTASAQCQQASAACMAAAGQFETAFAGVTPPPMIAANRTTLATLVATNFFGVNSPAIAATEAQYAEMWAQTSGVLYSYAGDSAATAGSMVPLIPPAPNTNPAGLAAQSAATGASAGQSAGTSGQTISGLMGSLGSLPQAASSLLSGGGGSGGLGQITKALQGLAQPLQSMMQPLMGGQGGGMLGSVTKGLSGLGSLAALSPITSAGGGFSSFSPTSGVAAAMGKATALPGGSNLSVPAQWVNNTQTVKTVAAVQPLTEGAPDGWAAAPRGGVGGTGMGMMPANAMGNSSTTGVAPNWMGTIRERPTDQGGLRTKLTGDLTGI